MGSASTHLSDSRSLPHAAVPRTGNPHHRPRLDLVLAREAVKNLMESVPAWPRSPDDVPDDATLVALLDRYHHHLLLLTALRFADYTDADMAAELGRHALAALALSSAIVADLHAEQQRIAREALRRGVPRADVAQAAPELRAGKSESCKDPS